MHIIQYRPRFCKCFFTVFLLVYRNFFGFFVRVLLRFRDVFRAWIFPEKNSIYPFFHPLKARDFRILCRGERDDAHRFRPRCQQRPRAFPSGRARGSDVVRQKNPFPFERAHGGERIAKIASAFLGGQP